MNHRRRAGKFPARRFFLAANLPANSGVLTSTQEPDGFGGRLQPGRSGFDPHLCLCLLGAHDKLLEGRHQPIDFFSIVVQMAGDPHEPPTIPWNDRHFDPMLGP